MVLGTFGKFAGALSFIPAPVIGWYSTYISPNVQ